MENKKMSPFKALIEKGKKTGKLSAQEINSALEATDNNAQYKDDSNALDRLYEILEVENIEVIDDMITDEFEGFDIDVPKTAEIGSVDDKSTSIDDAVKAYLREIGTFRLLTPEEEISLAQIIADDVEEEEKMNNEDMAELEERIAALPADASDKEKENLQLEKEALLGIKADIETRKSESKKAKDRLAEANLRLVVSIAKKYANRGLEFPDLVQEGNIGLIKAAEKFDSTKGFKFSTYATWWIRQAITRAIADQGRTIRIPVHMFEIINKVKKTSNQLLYENGKEPSAEEIAAKLKMPVEKVKDALRNAQEPVSLETPIGEEEDSHLGDFIQDENATSPEDAASKEFLKEALADVLSTLRQREAEVLRLRFGLDDGNPKTLEEVGKRLGVTRERVRQIEAKALRMIRHPSRAKQLRDFFEE